MTAPKPSPTSPNPESTSAVRNFYAVRAVVAVTWSIVFAGAGGDTNGFTTVLLVLYPGIDVAASLYDAHRQRGGPLRRATQVNALISVLATVGLGAAAAASNGAVLRAFGGWAVISGVLQLLMAVRRRSSLVGPAWPMILSGGLSVLAGAAFVASASGDDPTLISLAAYAGVGGVLYGVAAALASRAAPRNLAG